MEKVVLKSMTDFVLEQWHPENLEKEEFEEVYTKIHNYAKFLKQPLTLSMFVPCDKKGNVYVDYKTYQPKKGTICIPYEGLFEVSRKGIDVELLNEPQFWKDDQRFYNKRKYEEALKEYREAKERVLFEGFKLYKEKSGLTKVFNSESNIELYLPNNNKVERLAFGKIVLTESANKQILES